MVTLSGEVKLLDSIEQNHRQNFKKLQNNLEWRKEVAKGRRMGLSKYLAKVRAAGVIQHGYSFSSTKDNTDFDTEYLI